MFDQIIDSIENTPENVTIKRIKTLRDELLALEPLDYTSAKALKKRARLIADTNFGEDSGYTIEVANVSFEPPVAWNGLDEEGNQEEAREKYESAVTDLASTLATMVEELETPSLRPRREKQSAAARPVEAGGSHATVNIGG